ncbi:hypothetical protein [Chitinophaga sp. HK235]|uniref:hypothetical protein n=1 Tax=Chitinophaga sp. HK235 TaxID=2952571 RepID=UPI001BA93BA2|nr:hypothetical protein [Chitinophaga sp. HK235]
MLKAIGMVLGNGQDYTNNGTKVAAVLMVATFLSSCVTIPKARQVFIQHPDSFAVLSARYFPCVPDSAGKIPQYKPAGNRDYTSDIRLAKEAGDSVARRLEQARQYAADSIGRQCTDLVTRLTRQVVGLLTAVDSLQHAYQPCKPDTVPAPYPVRSYAELELIAQLQKKLQEQEAAHVKELSDRDKKISQQQVTIAEQQTEIVKHWVVHGVICVVLGLGIFLKVKKLIPWL